MALRCNSHPSAVQIAHLEVLYPGFDINDPVIDFVANFRKCYGRFVSVVRVRGRRWRVVVVPRLSWIGQGP